MINILKNLFSVHGLPECETHYDCRDPEQCQFGNCLDACLIQSCGINAICVASNHQSACTCPQGFTGNAREGCYPSKL